MVRNTWKTKVGCSATDINLYGMGLQLGRLAPILTQLVLEACVTMKKRQIRSARLRSTGKALHSYGVLASVVIMGGMGFMLLFSGDLRTQIDTAKKDLWGGAISKPLPASN